MSTGTTFLRRATDPLSPRSFALWFGVLGPPLAWASHLLLGDGLFELGCSRGFVERQIYGLSFQFWAVLQTVVLLGIDVSAGLFALWSCRKLRGMDEGVSPRVAGRFRSLAEKNETRLGRARGMAVAGMASSVVYGLLLIYGLLPTFFLRACEVSP
jgi:hypothetical protein